MKKAYLVLDDGSVFEGQRFGAQCKCTGELVFTTQVVGYVETLTDESNDGKIVIQTFPQIGVYGVNRSDFQGKCRLSGYVVREFCDTPSNFRSEEDIDTFLKNNGVPAICGVDTRELTRKIREKGSMKAGIFDSVPEIIQLSAGFSGGGVSSTEKIKADEEKYNVAILDLGVRKYIVDELLSLGCSVTLFPHDTKAEEILSASPDGIVISPGSDLYIGNDTIADEISQLFGKAPMFGIGAGHEMMAKSMGFELLKLPHGHRGENQPSKAVFAGARTYMTSQNHSYTVNPCSVKNADITFENLNDGSCEGLVYPEKNAFSVEFYPDSAKIKGGTGFLFTDFVSLMECRRK